MDRLVGEVSFLSNGERCCPILGAEEPSLVVIFGSDNDSFGRVGTGVSATLTSRLSDARLFDRLLCFVGLKVRGGSRGRISQKDVFDSPDSFVSPLVSLGVCSSLPMPARVVNLDDSAGSIFTWSPLQSCAMISHGMSRDWVCFSPKVCQQIFSTTCISLHSTPRSVEL